MLMLTGWTSAVRCVWLFHPSCRLRLHAAAAFIFTVQESELQSRRAEPKASAFIIPSRGDNAEQLWRKARKNKSFITWNSRAARWRRRRSDKPQLAKITQNRQNFRGSSRFSVPNR